MLTDGKISICIDIQNNAIGDVQITSSRPLNIPILFANKPVVYVENIINTIYQLCNTAHRFAFLSLLDKSGVITLSDNEILAYKMLLNLENLKEHCFSMMTKWTLDNSHFPKMALILQNIDAIKKALCPSGDALSLQTKQLQDGTNIQPLIAKLTSTIQDIFCDIDNLTNVKELDKWRINSASIGAQFLEYLMQANYASLGNETSKHLPPLTALQMSALLEDESIIKTPTYLGQTYENTSFSKLASHPLITKLQNIYGTGIFTRSTARILEVLALLRSLNHNYISLKKQDLSYTFSAQKSQTNTTAIDVSRGRLIHKMHFEGEQIMSYQILAPTEWNFHPRGILYDMIKNLSHTDEASLRKQIELLVAAIDPCVGYELEITEH